MRTRIALTSLALIVLAACSRTKPVVVGSKDSVEQQLLAEIISQHLEHKGIPVQRRPTGGDTRTVHQTLIDGGISLYPEYSGLIVSEILREIPSPSPTITFERARGEMQRIELVEFFAPLGFSNPTALVIRSAGNETISIASQAASSPTRWKIGLTYEFQNRPSALPSLNTYRLEMGAPLRSMNEQDLFKAMEDKDNPVNMVITNLTDAHITLPAYKALEDNLSSFPPAEAGILVRNDVLAAQPNLRGALLQLSGKFSVETMRKLNARVALDQRPIPEVAAEFLKSAGL